MKATGIIRRIDDLGRVVIPKEIRRTLKLQEGDPMEIFVDNQESITFKKYDVYYSPLEALKSFDELIDEDIPCEKRKNIKDKINEIKDLLKNED